MNLQCQTLKLLFAPELFAFCSWYMRYMRRENCHKTLAGMYVCVQCACMSICFSSSPKAPIHCRFLVSKFRTPQFFCENPAAVCNDMGIIFT